MKVAYLLGSLNRGGSETLMLDTFKHAYKVNFPCIGIYRKVGSMLNDFSSTNIQLTLLTPKSLYDFSYLHKLRKKLISENIDIVHAQQPIDALCAYICCLGTKIKIVQTLHGYDYDKSWLFKIILRFIFKRTNQNIFVSDCQKAYYINKYKLSSTHKQKTIYNGIAFEKLDNDSKPLIKKEFNIPINSVLFGCVGNFTSARDQLTICRFLNLLNNESIIFKFIFIGAKNENEPQLFDNCVTYCKKNNLSDKVLFIGSRDDVPEILKELDAFVYATNHDTFGIAVIEAIATNIPVFVNDWEAMVEITENGKLATLYKSKDENSLLRKFLSFIKEEQKHRDKAIKASEKVRNKYSIQAHVNQLRLMYQSL